MIDWNTFWCIVVLIVGVCIAAAVGIMIGALILTLGLRGAFRLFDRWD